MWFAKLLETAVCYLGCYGGREAEGWRGEREGGEGWRGEGGEERDGGEEAHAVRTAHMFSSFVCRVNNQSLGLLHHWQTLPTSVQLSISSPFFSLYW